MIKIFNYFLLMVIVIIFTSCCKEPKPCPDCIPEIHWNTQIVKVETKCKSNEKVDCDFSGDGIVPTVKLLKCVAVQKRLIEACVEFVDENETK